MCTFAWPKATAILYLSAARSGLLETRGLPWNQLTHFGADSLTLKHKTSGTQARYVPQSQPTKRLQQFCFSFLAGSWLGTNLPSKHKPYSKKLSKQFCAVLSFSQYELRFLGGKLQSSRGPGSRLLRSKYYVHCAHFQLLSKPGGRAWRSTTTQLVWFSLRDHHLDVWVFSAQLNFCLECFGDKFLALP